MQPLQAPEHNSMVSLNLFYCMAEYDISWEQFNGKQTLIKQLFYEGLRNEGDLQAENVTIPLIGLAKFDLWFRYVVAFLVHT